MKLLVLFISLSLCFFSCNNKLQTTKILAISIAKDSCYILLDSVGKPVSALRSMKIIENTLSDSIQIGFAVIPRGYIGEIPYLRFDTSRDKCIDPEIDKKYWPKTGMICINLYLHRPFKGEIKIQYNY